MGTLRFGANYVPSNRWMRDWAELDLSYTERDIASLKSIGMDHIRMHLMWDIFQPEPFAVNEAAIENLKRALDVCHNYQIDVFVTIFNGWMSGFVFKPAFAIGKNMFTDDSILESQLWLVEQLAAAIKDHPALIGVDIGNELNVLAGSKSDGYDSTQGDRWSSIVLAKAAACFPGKLIVSGVDHQSWFNNDHGFTRDHLAHAGDLTVLHTYPEFTGARKYGDESQHVMHLQGFMTEFARAYNDDPTRKVWIQEFGICKLWMRPEGHENYLHTSIANAMTCEGLWGFTFWGSHDIKREFDGFTHAGFEHKPLYKSFHALEYDLGLFNVNNEINPRGIYMRDIIKECRDSYNPIVKTSAIVVDDTTGTRGWGFAWKYGEKYVEMTGDGVYPQFILREHANDKAYLEKRHITELVEA